MCSFKVKLSTTLCVMYDLCLCTLYNDLRAAERIEKAVNSGYLMDGVRRSGAVQYPSNVAEMYHGELREIKPPYSSLAEVHRVFEKLIPCQLRAASSSFEQGRGPKRDGRWGSKRAFKTRAPAPVATTIDGHRVMIPARLSARP